MRLVASFGRTREVALAISLVAGFLLLIGLPSCLAAEPRTNLTPEILSSAPTVRVALANDGRGKNVEIRGPFRALPSGGPDARGDALASSPVTIEGDAIAVGAYRFPGSTVRFEPTEDGTLVWDGIAYHGALEIRRTADGRVLVVNEVNLEEYVAGVLGNEMPLEWPEAALRAQAIAARTYAVYQVRTGSRDGYDLETDTRSQVYRGLDRETPLARRIVAETAGVILTYRWKIFCTYFHSTCGGETIGAHVVFGGEEIEPLSGVRCGYCQSSRYFRWSHRIPLADLPPILARLGATVGAVRDVAVEPGPAGRAATVRFETDRGAVSVPAARFRMEAGASDIRSTAFDVLVVDGAAEIRGRGWGHGVGLCQVGAKGMAEAGYDALQILQHYYPGSEMVRLY